MAAKSHSSVKLIGRCCNSCFDTFMMSRISRPDSLGSSMCADSQVCPSLRRNAARIINLGLSIGSSAHAIYPVRAVLIACTIWKGKGEGKSAAPH